MTIPEFTPVQNLPQEEWRPVVGYEGWYEVSDCGRVRRVKSGPSTRAGHVMTPARARGNYPAVCLRHACGQQTKYVHHLVAEAFIGPRPEGMQINHRDKNRWNPRRENLEYVTPSENQRHSFANGARAPQGSHNGQSKLTEDDVRAIRASSEPQRTLAARYGVSQSVICYARSGRTWREVT